MSILSLKNISHSFNSKELFSDVNLVFSKGEKIALLGDNGSGKTTLLNIIKGDIEPFYGEIIYNNHCNIIYLDQKNFSDILSGGEFQMQKISEIFTSNPDIIILDEPTNHLDKDAREYLKFLCVNFDGLLIFASHDEEFIDAISTKILHVNNNRISKYNLSYKEFLKYISDIKKDADHKIKKLNREKENQILKKEKKQAENSKAKQRGIKKIANRKWPTVRSATKLKNSVTANVNSLKKISDDIKKIKSQISEIEIFDEIKPKFNVTPEVNSSNILQINNGKFGYSSDKLFDIDILIQRNSKIVITGKNGSGKSTFLKAVSGDKNIIKQGEWFHAQKVKIAYLDQFYNFLNYDNNVFDEIKNVSSLEDRDIRKYLNDFGFSKNEQILQNIETLSGGEKFRLQMAKICASPPNLLLLDEVTNNIDIKTKRYLISVLNNYPGAFILISHDNGFISQIEIDEVISF